MFISVVVRQKKKKVKAAAVTSLTLTEVKAQVASQTTQ